MKIAPSILNCDFGHLAEAVQRAEAGGADWIHVDVMDGLFVPNLTLGLPIVEAIRRATSLPLDIHLMIADPARYIERFRDAGGDSLTIHLEADQHPHRTIGEIHRLGARAGLALNPGTPVVHASELVEDVDLLLVMSVNPGFGGQAFIRSALRKLRQARDLVQQCNAACDVEVDGGIKLDNARDVALAGASVVVAGSFVYSQGDVAENIRALRATLNSG